MNFVDPPSGGADSNTLRKKSTSFNCGFCGQHFPKRHHKLIMTHVEQKHLGELEAVLLSSNRLCGPAAVAHQQDPTALDSNDNNVELSNEVCMMLSLSKTVNFSLESPTAGMDTNSIFFCFLFVKDHRFAWRANQ